MGLNEWIALGTFAIVFSLGFYFTNREKRPPLSIEVLMTMFSALGAAQLVSALARWFFSH